MKLLVVILLLLSLPTFAQEPKFPQKVTVAELPPEPVPTGSCKESYSGYVEVQEHGKAKNVNLSSLQIGDYVKKRLSEGYSLALYPQASGRLFVIETCASKN